MRERIGILFEILKFQNKDNVVFFVDDVKKTFSVAEICEILSINRNRYNYLKRSGLIDSEIAKKGGYLK